MQQVGPRPIQRIHMHTLTLTHTHTYPHTHTHTHTHLHDEAAVRGNHRAGAEEGLEVVRERRSARVTRVHSDEDADVGLCKGSGL